MSMFDRLTALAHRALNKTPPPAHTPDSEPRDWKSTLRSAVDGITGSAAAAPAPDSAPATPAPPPLAGNPLAPPTTPPTPRRRPRKPWV